MEVSGADAERGGSARRPADGEPYLRDRLLDIAAGRQVREERDVVSRAEGSERRPHDVSWRIAAKCSRDDRDVRIFRAGPGLLEPAFRRVPAEQLVCLLLGLGD